MKIRRTYMAVIFAAAALTAFGQNELNKEVTVTRAYEPSVSESFKMSLTPDMADTTKIRPEFNYQITPRPMSHGFAVTPIRPATVNTVDNKTTLPFYLKAGLGAPLQSVLDFSYSEKVSQRTTLGALATHQGKYKKIRNDQDIKAPALTTYNDATLFVDHVLNRNLMVSANANYNYTNITRYGYYNPAGEMPPYFNTSRKALSQFYHDAAICFGLNNSISQTANVKFGLDFDLRYFGDRFKYDQLQWMAGGYMGINLGVGEVVINAGYENTRGHKNQHEKFDVFLAGIGYNYDDGQLRFSLGADMQFMDEKGDSHSDNDNDSFKFMPQFSIEKDMFGGRLTPYAVVESKYEHNHYADLVKVNPYIYQGLHIPHTTTYDFRIGAKGKIFNAVRYNIFGGYSYVDDFYAFYNAYDLFSFGNMFMTVRDDAKIWTGGANLEAELLNSLSLYGGMQFYDYSLDNYNDASGMPDVEFNLGVKYNYRGKLYVDLGMDVMGERIFHEGAADYTSTPPQSSLTEVKGKSNINLRMSADYFLNKQFGVFLEMDNILNKDIYRFNRYPELGINFRTGVKLTF